MLNKVTLIGNLGADPEVKTLDSGLVVANLRIATTERRKKGEEWVDHTEWHRVVAFGKTAELAGKYLTKGRQVYIEGSLRTQKYQKDGQDHWSTDIVASELQFLGGKPAEGGQSEATKTAKPKDAYQRFHPFLATDDDGIPF